MIYFLNCIELILKEKKSGWILLGWIRSFFSWLSDPAFVDGRIQSFLTAESGSFLLLESGIRIRVNFTWIHNLKRKGLA